MEKLMTSGGSVQSQILRASGWRFSLDNGVLLAPYLQFLDGGYIGGRRHPNEHRWTIREGRIVFLDDVGRVASVFNAPQKNDCGLFRIVGQFREGFGVVLDQADLPTGIASPDHDLELVRNHPSTSRRNLVIVRANEHSLHRTWARDISDQDRSWDLCISFYGSDDKFSRDEYAEYQIRQNKFRKFTALWHLLHSESPLWHYDYICLPDDDLEMKWSDINLLFDTCDYFDLDLAQPSMTHDSFWNYPETRQNSKFILRYLAMIECMMPVFSREALKKCVPTFQLHPDGFGVDFAWSRLVGHNPTKVAIVDKVAVKHTRPTGDHSKNTLEGYRISSMFGKTGHYNPRERGGVYAEPPED